MHAEVCVKSLGWFLLSLVKIDDLPSLIGTIMSVPNDNLSSFFILSSMDIECLVVLDIDEVLISVGEDLPPS
jgi:hypothetical protein